MLADGLSQWELKEKGVRCPLTLEASHSPLVHVLVAETEEGFLNGVLWPKSLSYESRVMGVGRQILGRDSSRLGPLPWCTGSGWLQPSSWHLYLRVSACGGQRERQPCLLALRPLSQAMKPVVRAMPSWLCGLYWGRLGAGRHRGWFRALTRYEASGSSAGQTPAWSSSGTQQTECCRLCTRWSLSLRWVLGSWDGWGSGSTGNLVPPECPPTT